MKMDAIEIFFILFLIYAGLGLLFAVGAVVSYFIEKRLTP